MNYTQRKTNQPPIVNPRILQDYRIPILCANRFETNKTVRNDPSQKEEIIEWEYCCLLRSDSTNYGLTNPKQDQAKTLFDKSFIYGYLGYYDEAISALDNGLKVFSKDANAWNNLGVALGKIGKISKAKMIFSEILSLHPKKIESLLNLCWISNICGNYEDIIRLCNLIIDIEPNNKIARDIKEITRINIEIRNKVMQTKE